MALPKKKISRRRSRTRRAATTRIHLQKLTVCPECGNMRRSHHVCGSCGYYKDQLVLTNLSQSS